MQSEDKILSLCHIWLYNEYPDLRYCCFHIANERQTTAKEGAILKAKGIVSGVADYVVNYNGKTHYFEFKSQVGVLSVNQKKFAEQMKKQGFEVKIIRTFDEFKNEIKKIIK